MRALFQSRKGQPRFFILNLECRDWIWHHWTWICRGEYGHRSLHGFQRFGRGDFDIYFGKSVFGVVEYFLVMRISNRKLVDLFVCFQFWFHALVSMRIPLNPGLLSVSFPNLN